MSPRRRNERNNSPWSSKRSRSRSFSPGRRYRRSPRNDSRKRSRSRDKYSKREQTSNNYRNDYMSNKSISSTRLVPPPPSVHTMAPTAYTPVPEPDYKNYGGYSQYSMQLDYNPPTMQQPQFNIAYPPPPSWSSSGPDPNVMAAPPPWPVAPPIPPPVQPIPPVVPMQIPKETTSENSSREAAVAQEIQHQREELKKQRNDYLKKSDTMKKELKMLKEQMVDLIGFGDAPPSPTTKGYIDENEKLQGQIQKKISTIENVLDMLNSIIGEEEKEKKEVVPEKPKHESTDSSASSSSSSTSSESDDDSSPERLKTKVIESMKSRKESQKLEEKKKEKKEIYNESKFNYVFYDPEMNWCKVCNVFPKSAKDFLNHLHSKEHADKVDVPPTPWHDDFQNDEFPQFEHAQTKRVPIRGLQFFVPSRAWFCKICKVWMGDLHCASSHLKSRTHSSKYDEFFQKNLTYEVEWMAERQKALDKIGKRTSPNTSKFSQAPTVFDNIPLNLGALKNSDEKHSKSKKSESKKSKSKKKRSKKHKKGSSSSTSNSSSESDSAQPKDDRATSIRVAMRNIKKPDEEIKDDLTTKGGYNPMEIDDADKKKDDLMMNQWNEPQPIISESEKKLLEQLKGKLKSKPVEEPIKKETDIKKSSNRDHIRKRSPAVKERSPVSRSNRTNSNRDRYRNRNDRRSRSINRYNRRSRSRDRDRDRDRNDRRSRSRRRNGSRGRSPYHWRNNRRSTSRDRRRWSTSKSRSRSRSSTGSRRSTRIEKPHVRYPEFRPRIPENETKRRSDREKKLAGNLEEDNDRKKSPTSSNSSVKKASSASSYTGGKKLPFIGRMPVLAKKQQEQNNENNPDFDQMGENKSMDNMYAQYDIDGVYYDDLMPDPMQYASLMGAPPPPPPPMHIVDEKEILPPGIDELETDFVPKPIGEAPVSRKGPLPKDFEEALNIIFPGEKKVEKADLPLENNVQLPSEHDMNLPLDTKPKITNKMDLPLDKIIKIPLKAPEPPTIDNLDKTQIMPAIENVKPVEEIVVANLEIDLHEIEMPPPVPSPKKEIIYANVKESEKEVDYEQSEKILNEISKTVSDTGSDHSEKLPISLPEEKYTISDKTYVAHENNHLTEDIELPKTKEPSPAPVPNPKDNEWRPQELDDLAMLGIDADDLAAQCI